MNVSSSKNLKKLLKGSLYTLIITIFIINFFPILTRSFELKITDLKFNMRRSLDYEPSMNSSIAIVELDDNAKKESGFDLWPYGYYAQALNNIAAGGANSIGVDILFSVSIDTLGWEEVVDVMIEAGNMINPYKVRYSGPIDKKIDINNEKELFEYLEFEELPLVKPGLVPHVSEILYIAGGRKKTDFLDASAGIGIVNINPDEDGVLRRLPIVSEINGYLAPHFFLRLLASHVDWELNNMELISSSKLILHKFPVNDTLQDIEIPLDSKGNMIINHISRDKINDQADSRDFNLLSAWKVKQSAAPPALDNKTIIFGDHSSNTDISITPLDGIQYNPIIFAVAMSNILDQSFITPTSTLSEILTILIIIGLLFVLINYLDVLWVGLGSLGLILLYGIINFSLFIFCGIDLSLFNVAIPLIITSGYVLIFLIYETQVNVGVLEGSLQSYLSPHLMDKLKNNPGDMMKPGGERKRITVLFSDIAGFTSFTDQADPEEVQVVLEEYFSKMTAIVFKQKGIVDKYYGDGIMAFFENPKDGITSAQAAVKSAVQMQEKAVLLDKKYKDQKRFPFSIYVGIATGYAKVGNIGPPEKVDYTVIGSVVNRAARLDGAGKSGDILIDEDTYFFVKDDYDIEDFGTHSLKGFEKPVQVYKLKS